MQAFSEYVMQLRNDVRLLRLDKDRLTRAHQSQKQTAERLAKRVKEQAQRIKELERENEQLKRERKQSRKTKNRYQVALFDQGNFRHPKTAPKKKKGGKQAMRIPIEKAMCSPRRGRNSTSLSQPVACTGRGWLV